MNSNYGFGNNGRQDQSKATPAFKKGAYENLNQMNSNATSHTITSND